MELERPNTLVVETLPSVCSHSGGALTAGVALLVGLQPLLTFL